MRLFPLLFALLWVDSPAIVDARPLPTEQAARASPLVHHAPDRVLVRFRPGTAASAVAEAHRSAAGALLDVLPGIGVQVVRVATGSVTAKVAAYQANPNVLYAEPDYYRLLVVPNEEPGPTPAGGGNYFAEQWYLHNSGQPHTYVLRTPLGDSLATTSGTADADIDAPEAWDISRGLASGDPAGYGAPKVAVLDSGADCASLELSGKCLERRDFVGNQAWDSCPAQTPACDNLGHGTFTASEVAANTDNAEGIAGVGWHTGAGIFKVCYQELVSDGVNLFFVGLCPVSASAAAIVAAASDQVENNVLVRSQYQVITMSYGSDWIDANGNISPTTPSNAECDAVQFARDAGLVLVAGAGNGGDTQRVYPAACTDPNGASTVIAVAASDHHDYRASFSTYSQIADPWVSLAAPGQAVIGILPDAACGLSPGTDSCVDWWDGTSMAAPLVAGAASLVWTDLYADLKAAGAELAPAACQWQGQSCNQVVRQRLESGADKTGAQGQNMQEWTRHGRLNVHGALSAASLPAAPVLAPPQVVSVTSGNQAVALSWSHDGANLSGFELERNSLSKTGRIVATVLIPDLAATARAHVDDVGSGRYRYRLRARNGEQASAWSTMSTTLTVSDGVKGGGKPPR
jgi:hypothetical protein